MDYIKNKRKGKPYRLKKSEVFLNKYGRYPLTIIIEDRYENIFNKEWQDNLSNPATAAFVNRIMHDTLQRLIGQNVYYGKIENLGECVFESELEETKES